MKPNHNALKHFAARDMVVYTMSKIQNETKSQQSGIQYRAF